MGDAARTKLKNHQDEFGKTETDNVQKVKNKINEKLKPYARKYDRAMQMINKGSEPAQNAKEYQNAKSDLEKKQKKLEQLEGKKNKSEKEEKKLKKLQVETENAKKRLDDADTKIKQKAIEQEVDKKRFQDKYGDGKGDRIIDEKKTAVDNQKWKKVQKKQKRKLN